MPDTITQLGYGTFHNCSLLTELKLPSGLTTLGNYVFEGCSGLRELTIPQGVKKIPWGTFKDCSNLKIFFPDGITQVDDTYYCASTAGLNYCGMGSDTAKTLSGSGYSFVTDEEDFKYRYRIQGPEYRLGVTGSLLPTDKASVEIPAGVSWIGSNAFSGRSALTEVILPDSLEEIGSGAFRGCGLNEIQIPAAVTTIGANAFAGCASLDTVDLPGGITSIGENAFSGCAEDLRLFCEDASDTAAALLAAGYGYYHTFEGFLCRTDSEGVTACLYTGEAAEVTVPTASARSPQDASANAAILSAYSYRKA